MLPNAFANRVWGVGFLAAMAITLVPMLLWEWPVCRYGGTGCILWAVGVSLVLAAVALAGTRLHFAWFVERERRRFKAKGRR